VSRESDTASVRTVGELDLATVPVLSAQIADLRQAGCRHVIIDLSDLTFMDSTGCA
jgi:anti-sigma B factor antagonist